MVFLWSGLWRRGGLGWGREMRGWRCSRTGRLRSVVGWLPCGLYTRVGSEGERRVEQTLAKLAKVKGARRHGKRRTCPTASEKNWLITMEEAPARGCTSPTHRSEGAMTASPLAQRGGAWRAGRSSLLSESPGVLHRPVPAQGHTPTTRPLHAHPEAHPHTSIPLPIKTPSSTMGRFLMRL